MFSPAGHAALHGGKRSTYTGRSARSGPARERPCKRSRQRRDVRRRVLAQCRPRLSPAIGSLEPPRWHRHAPQSTRSGPKKSHGRQETRKLNCGLAFEALSSSDFEANLAWRPSRRGRVTGPAHRPMLWSLMEMVRFGRPEFGPPTPRALLRAGGPNSRSRSRSACAFESAQLGGYRVVVPLLVRVWMTERVQGVGGLGRDLEAGRQCARRRPRRTRARCLAPRAT
jgi:hypothetical protein